MMSDDDRISRKKASAAKYRAAHREQSKIYFAAWRVANSAKIKLLEAAYRKDNRDKIAASVSRWQSAHRDKMRGHYAKWYAANSEKVRAKDQLRRALKRKNKIGDIEAITHWEASWRTKDRVRCYWCMKSARGKECHADHIQPLSKGGAHSLNNLCIACRSCNLSKHAKTPEEWNEKLLQPSLLLGAA